MESEAHYARLEMNQINQVHKTLAMVQSLVTLALYILYLNSGEGILLLLISYSVATLLGTAVMGETLIRRKWAQFRYEMHRASLNQPNLDPSKESQVLVGIGNALSLSLTAVIWIISILEGAQFAGEVQFAIMYVMGIMLVVTALFFFIRASKHRTGFEV